MLQKCRGGDKRYAKGKEYNNCGKEGHFSRSRKCKKSLKNKKNKESKVREVKQENSEEEDSDSSVGRLMEEQKVRAARGGGEEDTIQVTIGIAGPEDSKFKKKFRPLADTGVKRTILNLKVWEMIKERCKVTKTQVKFRPYGTDQHLPIIGRANV